MAKLMLKVDDEVEAIAKVDDDINVMSIVDDNTNDGSKKYMFVCTCFIQIRLQCCRLWHAIQIQLWRAILELSYSKFGGAPGRVISRGPVGNKFSY